MRKLGLVYEAARYPQAWASNSALMPTPTMHPEGHIRVFAGFWDDAGIMRVYIMDA